MSASHAFRTDVPFLNDVGIEFVSADRGRSVVALALAPRHLNSWNGAHGGVLMTLLDVAMAVAGRSLDAEAGGAVTIEMQTTFIQSAQGGSRLVASGHAYHRSATLVFCEAEVRDTAERLIVKGQGIFKFLREGSPRHPVGER